MHAKISTFTVVYNPALEKVNKLTWALVLRGLVLNEELVSIVVTLADRDDCGQSMVHYYTIYVYVYVYNIISIV